MSCMKIIVNLNDRVRFKPTDAYREAYRKWNESSRHPIALRVDAKGYVNESLWQVMQIAGPHVGLGNPVFCEDCDVEIVQ